MFGDTKQKYVRLKAYKEIIIFPSTIDHSNFRHWEVESAGFCYVHEDHIKCFGKSVGLGIESKEEDSKIATKQIFGE